MTDSLAYYIKRTKELQYIMYISYSDINKKTTFA